MTVNQSNDRASAHPETRREVLSPMPMTVGELERIIGAARTMPDSVDGIPGRLWWPAFVIAIADVGQFAPVMLGLPIHAYNRENGTLRAGGKLHLLHTHTANALEAMGAHVRDLLFPWHLDGRKPPYFMLYHHYRNLLHRAGLSPHPKDPFVRLRTMAVEAAGILDCVDPHRRVQPVQGHPYRKPRKERRAKPTQRQAEVYTVANDSPDTIRAFFKTTYQPLRLIGSSDRTIESYQTAINAFASFLACEPTLHHFDDEHIDRFKIWAAMRLNPSTINNYLRHLLAIWRYAWKKRKVEEQPRDVEFLQAIKPLPEAWTQEEMGRLLTSAAQAQGEVCGIAARLWWPALILTLYDTGLRIRAVMNLRSEDLNLGDGTLLARAETQKQKADQYFRVHIETLESLRAISPERRFLVFNYPNYRSDKTTFYARFTKILKRAGLPTTDRDKFHKIRRTSATFVADAIDENAAQRHLGHSDLSMTARYLDLAKIRQKVPAADVMPRPEWQPAGEMIVSRRCEPTERFECAAMIVLTAPGVPPEAIQEAIRRSIAGEFITRECACEIVSDHARSLPRIVG